MGDLFPEDTLNFTNIGQQEPDEWRIDWAAIALYIDSKTINLFVQVRHSLGDQFQKLFGIVTSGIDKTIRSKQHKLVSLECP